MRDESSEDEVSLPTTQSIDIPGGLFPKHPGPGAAWNEFAQEFDGHAVLQQETIYAIPSKLVEAICEHAPGVLAPDDQHFELQLSQIAGAGFFMKRPISYPLLADWSESVHGQESEEQRAARVRHQQTAKRLLAMQVEELRRSGYSEADIDEYFRDQQLAQGKIDDCRTGYAGWLVANPQFRKEVIDLIDC